MPATQTWSMGGHERHHMGRSSVLMLMWYYSCVRASQAVMTTWLLQTISSPAPNLFPNWQRKEYSYVRENKLQSCKLMDEKSTKKRGRGTHDISLTSCGDNALTAVKWLDNGSVTMLSNCCGTDPVVAVRRWDKQAKDHALVGCPVIIPIHNRFMGGVDLLEKMCFCCRPALRSKRRCMYGQFSSLKTPH